MRKKPLDTVWAMICCIWPQKQKQKQKFKRDYLKSSAQQKNNQQYEKLMYRMDDNIYLSYTWYTRDWYPKFEKIRHNSITK